MEGVRMELWKDIPNYEGIYQVSNQGNIRSLLFRNNIVVKEKIRILKPTDNGNGYLIVGLKASGKRKNYYVHRLVAAMFCKKVDNCNYVNHKDRNKYNNNAENLEWCTQKQNVQYSAHYMRHEKSISKPTNTGEKYISIKGNRYCVYLRKIKKSSSFLTLEEAIAYRNEAIKGGI
jgi:hypothetical protein